MLYVLAPPRNPGWAGIWALNPNSGSSSSALQVKHDHIKTYSSTYLPRTIVPLGSRVSLAWSQCPGDSLTLPNSDLSAIMNSSPLSVLLVLAASAVTIAAPGGQARSATSIGACATLELPTSSVLGPPVTPVPSTTPVSSYQSSLPVSSVTDGALSLAKQLLLADT
jgi:hypothetical protein